MTIEGDIIANSNDVVASIAICRLDPNSSKTGIGVLCQERISQNMACTTGKEHPIRQLPSEYRITFYAFGKPVQSAFDPVEFRVVSTDTLGIRNHCVNR